MTENSAKPLRVESWMSLNGRTYAVCDGHAILSMHKSQEEAEAALEAVREAHAERERQWAPSEDM